MPSLPKSHSKTRRERKKATYRVVRPEVRRKVWDDQQGRCVWPTCRKYIFLSEMHAHEVVFRSALGSPIDPANVVGVCGKCHEHLHVRVGGKLKKIEWEWDEEAPTPVRVLQFFERANGNAPWVSYE